MYPSATPSITPRSTGRQCLCAILGIFFPSGYRIERTHLEAFAAVDSTATISWPFQCAASRVAGIRMEMSE